MLENNISEIILRQLLGTASEEERQWLEAWRKESAEHDAMYLRLTSPAHLEAEWHKRQAVNCQRAAKQMQDRIGRKSSSRILPLFYRTAAAIVLLVLGGVLTHYLLEDSTESSSLALVKEEAELQQVSPGQTKAVVTLPSGEEITVGQSLTAADMASLLSPQQRDDVSGHAPSESSPITLSVPRGGEFKIELEDGTEVWLNAQSRLIYPETFSHEERRVQLEGEAYFKVAKDASKPFFVETYNQQIRVLGTEFNINSYQEDNTVQTTLVTGRIAMQQKGDDSREMILTPGHQAVFDKGQQSMKVKRVDTEVVTSWKEGMFVFEDQNLASIMLTLSRWYDFTYEFLDHKAATTVFMGRIPRYVDFQDVISIIEASGGLHLELKQRKLTIASK